MNTDFFSKALENLRAAEALSELGLFNSAANRAYYAAFQAALAVITVKGLQPHTDHAKVQATFNGEVIRRSKYITASFKRYLLEMQNIRNIADYETISISKRKAEKQLAMAQEFITIIAKEIQQ
jgi:uncharacterized protein (UPF0332 family)